MLDRDQALELLDRVLRASNADATEVALLGGRCALTRFAANEIHQSVDETRVVLRVRAAWYRGGAFREGVATTERLDADGVTDVLHRVRLVADQAPAIINWPQFAAPGYYSTSPVSVAGAFDARAANADAIWRANEAARAILRVRRDADLRVSGYVRVRDGAIGDYGDPQLFAIANSDGVRLAHRATDIDVSLSVAHTSGVSAWGVQVDHQRGALDVDALAERLIERARVAPLRRALEPGRHRVLLEPAAVAALLPFALPHFSRRAIDEARSFLSDRLGTAVAASAVSLTADPADPVLAPRPFDGEGVPTRRLALIDAGVARDVATGRTDAGEERDANGYAPLQPSGADPQPHYARLDAGAGTVDELAARHPDTPLIARLWYNRSVHARSARVTGMTRDGFFARSGGALAGALVDMRYNVGVFDLLANVVDASAPVRVENLLVPALLVDGFPLDSATVAT
jgi:predicted Zn-dependent protease